MCALISLCVVLASKDLGLFNSAPLWERLKRNKEMSIEMWNSSRILPTTILAGERQISGSRNIQIWIFIQTICVTLSSHINTTVTAHQLGVQAQKSNCLHS